MGGFLNELLGFSSPREYQTRAKLFYGQYYEHNNSLDVNKIPIM